MSEAPSEHRCRPCHYDRFLTCVRCGCETNQYCCNVGSFHVTRARAQVALIEDECVLRVLLGDDRSLVRAAVVAVGAEELESLAAALAATGKLVQAAQVTFARTFGESSYAALERQGAALALLARAGASDDAQRLRCEPSYVPTPNDEETPGMATASGS